MRSNLLILIPGFAKDENDTTCIPFAQLFIRTVNKIYPQVKLNIIAIDFPYTSQEYNWFGNKVIPLNGQQMLRPLLWLKLYKVLKRSYKQKDLLGVLNFWCADNAFVTQYFSRWNNIKYFTWLQGQDARKSNRMLQLFKPKKENLIALSDFISNEFKKNYSITPSHTIYPGVNKELFSDNQEKDIDIIAVGSLIPLKRYDLFIDIISIISTRYPKLNVMIVGKGPGEQALKKIMVEKQLETNIEFKGELDHNEVIELMKRSRLLLHTSSYEGYGMVMLEALAAGCHVISSVQPELMAVDHWHILKTKEEMTAKALDILQLPHNSFYPVIPRNIDDCVINIMDLFERTHTVYTSASVREVTAE